MSKVVVVANAVKRAVSVAKAVNGSTEYNHKDKVEKGLAVAENAVNVVVFIAGLFGKR